MKKRKLIFIFVLTLFISISSLFFNNLEGVQSYAAKALSFNTGLNLSSLPKIIDKVDDLVLFDDGKLYLQKGDVFELKLDNIKAIASDDKNYFLYTTENHVVYFDHGHDSFEGVSILDNVTQVLKTDKGILSFLSDGSYVYLGSSDDRGFFKYIDVPQSVGTVVKYIDFNGGYLLNSDGKLYEYMNLTDDVYAWTLTRSDLDDIYLLEDYIYDENTNTTSSTIAMLSGSGDLVIPNGDTYDTYSKINSIGKYHILSNKQLTYWDEDTPKQSMNNVWEVTFFDDEYLEFYEQVTTSIDRYYDYHVYKRHNKDSYTTTTDENNNIVPLEYDKGFYEVRKYSIANKPYGLYRAGFYETVSGYLEHSKNYRFPYMKDYEGVLLSTSKEEINTDGKVTTNYNYENYVISSGGSAMYYLKVDNGQKYEVVGGVEYLDEKYNYVITASGKYFGFVDGDFVQYKFSEDEEVLIKNIYVADWNNPELDIGDTHQYSVMLYPKNHTENVVWYSSDETMATIDQNGLLTAVGKGNPRIYATSQVFGSNATELPQPKIYPNIESFKFSEDYENVYIDLNKMPICFYVYPYETRKRDEFTIVSNEHYSVLGTKYNGGNEYCATILSDKLKTNISLTIASNLDDDVKTTITVNSTPSHEKLIEAIDAKKNYSDSIVMDLQHYTTIDDLFSFSSDDYKDTLFFTSTDESVVKVDENGKVTAVGTGYATIYVKYKMVSNSYGEVGYQTVIHDSIRVIDREKEFQEILDRVPNETAEKYSDSFIENAPLDIFQNIKDDVKNYDYKLTLKEGNVYTLTLSDTLQNNQVVNVSKDITIKKAEANETIENLNTSYKFDLYTSVINYNHEIAREYVINDIKKQLNVTELDYTIYNSKDVIDDYQNYSSFDLVINIDDNHYHKKVNIERESIFNIAYDVRNTYDVEKLIEEYIASDERFKDLGISASYYTSLTNDEIDVFGKYRLEGNIPQYYYLTVIREEKPITNIEIEYDKTDTVMYENKTLRLTPIITPKESIYEEITWSVDDKENASISTIYNSTSVNLNVSKPGTYKVTINVEDYYSKTIEITFTEPNPKKVVNIFRDSGEVYYLYDDGSLFASGSYNEYYDEWDWTYTTKAEFIRGNVIKPIISINSIKNYYLNTQHQLISSLGEIFPIDNVKDAITVGDHYNSKLIVLTYNGEIYEYDHETKAISKVVIDNVKEIKGIKDTVYALTTSNKLYVWGANIFGEKFNNGEYINLPMKLVDNVVKYDYRYALTSDKNLYYWHSRILNPSIIETNVSDILLYEIDPYEYESDWDPFYIKKDNIAYKNIREFNNKYVNSSLTKIDSDVKQLEYDSFYLKEDGTLYYGQYNQIKNVKEIRYTYLGNEQVPVYITNDNKLYQIQTEYNRLTDSYDYYSVFIADNIDTFIYDDLIRKTDDTYWAWNEASSGAVNMPNDDVTYPAKVITELYTGPISSEGVYIYSGTKRHITVGEELDILAVVLPYNATNKNISWEVSDENLASITSEGVLTTKKAGIVTVTVTTEDGAHQNSIDIEIHPLPNQVIIDKEQYNKYIYSHSNNYDMGLGRICADIKPDNTLIHTLNWTSSNEDIITIDRSYEQWNEEYDNCAYIYLKPNALGNVTLTATTTDGKYSDEISFTIIPNYDDYTFDTEDYEIVVGGTTKAYLDITPSNFPKEYYSFKVAEEDKDIISIDENGIVTGLKPGEARIELHMIGSHSIYKQDDYYIPTTYVEVVEEGIEITFDIEELYLSASAEGFTDRGTMYADYYRTNDTSSLIWTSSDESIVKIIPATDSYNYPGSSTNIAVGNKTGTAIVTVKSADGKYSDSFTYHVVNVNYPTKEIVLDLGKGQIHNIGKYASDIGITYDYWYYYESNDKSIVTVDDYGKVTPLKEGSTTISTAVFVLNSIRDDDDLTIVNIPVRVINTGSVKTLQINPDGGIYSGNTVISGKENDVVTINTPTKSFVVNVTENTNYNLNVFANFTGWILSGGGTLVNNKYTFGNQSGVITAKWSYNKVNLTTPVKDGYTFAGWYTDSAYTNAFNTETLITGNINLYAKFVKNEEKVSLTIDPNGGSYSGEKILHNYKGNTALINTPTKAFNVTIVTDKTTTETVNATFTGWTLNGTGTLVNNTYTFGNGNAILTASWRYNKILLPIPAKEGYTFKGWYTDSSYSNSFNTETLITKNISLYAKFVKNQEQITVIRGDANNDGKITALDYVKVKNHIMKSAIISDSNELYGADMNADGKITALDYVAIKNKIMKG